MAEKNQQNSSQSENTCCTCDQDMVEVIEQYRKTCKNEEEFQCAKRLVEHFIKLKKQQPSHKCNAVKPSD